MRSITTSSAFFLSILCAIVCHSASAQVGFNNPTPHASSIIDLTATDKGLLVPRMTSSQRLAITNPANGLLVFDKTLKGFCVYDTVANPDKWMLLTAMKADAFPNGNVTLSVGGNVGLGTNTPAHRLDVAGNTRTSDTLMASTGIFSGALVANSFSGNGSVPSGAIIMWSGTTPPAGWVICDGSNGAPDLRGRFIVGSGTNANPASGDINPNYVVGTKGGENMHLLSRSELPKHKHTISTSATDNGIMTIGSSSTTDSQYLSGPGSPSFLNPGSGSENHTSVNSSAHSHSVSGSTGDGTTDGVNGQSHENRPPYYVLTFIMKL